MRLKWTDLGDLGVFAAVARHRSFARAAQDLAVSASAISHTLRHLEERLGVRLLNRTTRAVTPTEAGMRLLDRVEPALREMAEALSNAAATRPSPSGPLRLNMPQTAALVLLRPITAELLSRYPGIRLDVTIEERFVDIVAGGFDAGIRFGDTVPRDMISKRVGFPHRFVVVGSPAYFARHGSPATPQDLVAHNCIRWSFLGGGYLKWTFEGDHGLFDVDIEGSLVSNDNSLIEQAVLDGAGLARFLDRQVVDHVAAGRLVQVLDAWCPRRPGFSLYYPSRRQVPQTLQVFISLLQETFTP